MLAHLLGNLQQPSTTSQQASSQQRSFLDRELFPPNATIAGKISEIAHGSIANWGGANVRNNDAIFDVKPVNSIES